MPPWEVLGFGERLFQQRARNLNAASAERALCESNARATRRTRSLREINWWLLCALCVAARSFGLPQVCDMVALALPLFCRLLAGSLFRLLSRAHSPSARRPFKGPLKRGQKSAALTQIVQRD